MKLPGAENCEGEGAGARLSWGPTTVLARTPEADARHSARLRDRRYTGERADTMTVDVIETIGSGGRPALQAVAKVHLASAPGREY